MFEYEVCMQNKSVWIYMHGDKSIVELLSNINTRPQPVGKENSHSRDPGEQNMNSDNGPRERTPNYTLFRSTTRSCLLYKSIQDSGWLFGVIYSTL